MAPVKIMQFYFWGEFSEKMSHCDFCVLFLYEYGLWRNEAEANHSIEVAIRRKYVLMEEQRDDGSVAEVVDDETESTGESRSW